MKRSLFAVAVLAAWFALGPGAQAADKKLEADVQEAIGILKKTDSSIETFFKDSAGYVVFPSVGKGGIGVGAARGRGVLFEKGQAVGEAALTQVTVGFQLGGQVFSEVIFFEAQKNVDDFKDETVEFSAQVSAVAAAEGVAKTAKYQHGVAVFTVAKGGLMYEASVGGQKFSYDPFDAAEAKARKEAKKAKKAEKKKS